MTDRNLAMFLVFCVSIVGGIVYRDVRNDSVCIERSGMPCQVLIEKMKGWDR